MLVPTMTPEEIFAELQKDYDFLNNKIREKCVSPFCKYVKRAMRGPFVKVYTLTSSKTSIQYGVICFAYNKGEWKNPHVLVYTRYSHEGGTTLIMFEEDRFAIRIYTPHFMARYKERFGELLNDEQETLLVSSPMVMFILRNHDDLEPDTMSALQEVLPKEELKKFEHGEGKFIQDENYERYTMVCQDGLCLCERHKQNNCISIYDTYISPDKFFENQVLDFMPAANLLLLRRLHNAYPTLRKVFQTTFDTAQETYREHPLYERIVKVHKIVVDLYNKYPTVY